MGLEKKISEISNGIVAIGFNPSPDKITIVGSGFCISDSGKILSAAHVYNQVPQDQVGSLKALVLKEQELSGLNRYAWHALELLNKDEKNDLAIFQVKNYSNTLLKEIGLGDSEKVEVGMDSYFIGFPYGAQLMNDGFGITLVANRGMVSNVKRDGLDPRHPKNWFIIDAISNPGNSGCPLLDAESNKVIGVMTISFRIKSQVNLDLDIREPMHIAGAKPINLAKGLIK
jgi:S1-C subfamily serine protease